MSSPAAAPGRSAPIQALVQQQRGRPRGVQRCLHHQGVIWARATKLTRLEEQQQRFTKVSFQISHDALESTWWAGRWRRAQHHQKTLRPFAPTARSLWGRPTVQFSPTGQESALGAANVFYPETSVFCPTTLQTLRRPRDPPLCSTNKPLQLIMMNT